MSSTVVVGAVAVSSVDEVSVLRGQLARARERIETLEVDNAGLVCDNEKLTVNNEKLTSEVAKLRARLEESRRAGKRQAAPFSRGEKKSDPKRPGRKPGEAYGRRARREAPPPERVDEVIEVGLPQCCGRCGGRVVFDEMAEQHQEEFVPAHARVRRYEIALGHCTGCNRRVRGPRHPDQTSDALGAAGVMLGPAAHALAAWLHVGLGVPMAKTAEILHKMAGIKVTAGGLHSALHTTAADAETTYQTLLDSLGRSTAVAADETGWRIDGERGWLWVYVGDQVTVYDIADGRGYEQAKQILGADFAGVLERDGWAPYRKFVAARHQSCLAHLTRRCREMIDDSVAGQAKVPHALRRILQDALAARDDGLEGDMLAETVADLQQRIDTFCQRQPTHAPNRRLVDHITRESDHLLTFLTFEGVQATNWRAEQGLRPMVVNRKHWGGNKTRAGADSQAVIASVLRTAIQHDLDPIETLATIRTTGHIPEMLVDAIGPSP
jgi:transposase